MPQQHRGFWFTDIVTERGQNGNPSFGRLCGNTLSSRERRKELGENLDTYGIVRWIAGTTYFPL
jgi:hypothetical protein